MKRVLLLGAVSALAIVVACSSSSEGDGGNGASSGSGTTSGHTPAPGEKLPDGGFNDDPLFVAPECVTAAGPTSDEAGAPPSGGDTVKDDTGTATATVEGKDCARTLTVDSTAKRMDNDPAGARTFEEKDHPSLQSGSILFDALYQLALDDAKEASVDAIKDYAFNDGAPTSCGTGGCFETGKKWNYVWTRDLSYASNLGLGWVDPLRVKNSLEFKLSKRRDGTDLEIVQDTGTGGSYPISTDRAVWALGAGELLQHLTGDARTAFRDKALEAAKNTIEQDRATIFDETDGLYRGEQSFLDWREQTYPGWTNPDVVNIGMSKSLSTNAAHLALLDLAKQLATETGDDATAKTMGDRADKLRAAIAKMFWLSEESELSTFLTTSLDPAPVHRYDALGVSLAILLDATSPAQGKDAIAHYPALPKGPPVVFPEQQNTPIYHNRAIWPFVTAYWVKAAKKVNNDRAFELGVRSLVRGSALNLSNMENMEMVTGAPHVDDGDASGPVVNSQRQIWSVAGYIGMVNGSLFGIAPTSGGVSVQPYFTRGLRSLFPATNKLALNNVTVRGHKLSVVVNLPDDPNVAAGGAYVIKTITFNGVPPEANGFIDDVRLKDRNLVEVDFGLPTAPAAPLKVITDASDYHTIYAPKTPSLTVAPNNGKVQITADFAGEKAAEITWSVYRDGARVAFGLGAFTNEWTDTDTNGDATPSHCYSVETRWGSSGNVSQHARPQCFWSADPSKRIVTNYANAGAFDLKGGAISGDHTTNWGDVADELATTFTAQHTGAHLVQAEYANGAGPINTGITCGVKHVTIEEQPGGNVVGSGYMLMPQRGDWASFGDSSFVKANLTAGKTYKVRLAHDGKSTNMSSFDHFAAYTGGLGGKDGVFFKVDVRAIKLLSLAP